MRHFSSIINSAVGGYVDAAGEAATGPIKLAYDNAESPIEALLLMHISRNDRYLIARKRGHSIEEVITIAEKNRGKIVMFQQVQLGIYRLDFLFVMWDGELMHKLAVECDGKDFHYSNIKQIIHDNHRISFLAKEQIYTARFIGFELHENTSACVETIDSIFTAWVEN